MLLIQIWILAFCLCNTRFSLLYSVELILPLIQVVALYSCMKNFVVPFLQVLSSLDKALIEKLMLVQVGLFCTSNLQSGAALHQDFVIHKVG